MIFLLLLRFSKFSTSSIFFDYNSDGLVLLCSEDTEYISIDKLKVMINDFIEKFDVQRLSNQEYVQNFIKQNRLEIKLASKELYKLYSFSNLGDDLKINIDDNYEKGRTQLVKRYLQNLIVVQIMRENREVLFASLDELKNSETKPNQKGGKF